MITENEIKEIRVKIFDEIKHHIENSPNQSNTRLAVAITEGASQVCARMLIEFAKKLGEKL